MTQEELRKQMKQNTQKMYTLWFYFYEIQEQV